MASQGVRIRRLAPVLTKPTPRPRGRFRLLTCLTSFSTAGNVFLNIKCAYPLDDAVYESVSVRLYTVFSDIFVLCFVVTLISVLKMYRLINYLLPFFIFTNAALAAAIPPQLQQWSTPVTCLRDLATYDFRRCSVDLNDLIRVAHESLVGIELVGMRLIDAIGPASVRR